MCKLIINVKTVKLSKAQKTAKKRIRLPVYDICSLQTIAKISVTSPIIINMPAKEPLAGETKCSFV